MRPKLSAPIVVPDLISAILAPDRNPVPYSREIAALTFGAILQYPAQATMVRRARLFAACSAIKELKLGQIPPFTGDAERDISLLASTFLDPFLIASALLDHDEDELSFYSNSLRNQPDLNTAEAIAAFLLHCPSELEPSVNKAVFFIEKDGFGIGIKEKDRRYERAGRTTSKKAWSRFGMVSAFLLAQTATEVSFNTSPDEVGCIKHTLESLSENRARKFFSSAAYIQSELERILSGSKISRGFFDFPKTCKKIAVELPPLSKAQISVLADYRAPSPY